MVFSLSKLILSFDNFAFSFYISVLSLMLSFLDNFLSLLLSFVSVRCHRQLNLELNQASVSVVNSIHTDNERETVCCDRVPIRDFVERICFNLDHHVVRELSGIRIRSLGEIDGRWGSIDLNLSNLLAN